MAKFTLDQNRLLDLHARLDHVSYGVGTDSSGKLIGKAGFGDDPAKIPALDCSGYVRYILYNASEGKIVVPNGSWHQNDWCVAQGLRSTDYAKSANLADNVLRLGYFAKKPGSNYGHVWLVLNGQTLESHGSQGVNRRPWNTRVLLDNATHCYELATTTVLSPARYRLSARIEDPEIRRLLENAIDNDRRIDFQEVMQILIAVLGDGKITMQEVKDLRTILEYSKSLQGPGKLVLELFVRSVTEFKKRYPEVAQTARSGPQASAQSPAAKPARTPTEKADRELYRRHPELNGRPLTPSAADAPLRNEWMKLYRQYGGT